MKSEQTITVDNATKGKANIITAWVCFGLAGMFMCAGCFKIMLGLLALGCVCYVCGKVEHWYYN